MPHSLIFRMPGIAMVISIGALLAPAGRAEAATFQTVLSTSTPQSALVAGPDGNFYGTSRYGGTNDLGAVFRFTGGGTYEVLYSFTGGTDGSSPNSALVVGPDGELYGTAQYGGNQNAGAIFKITTTGVFTVLWTLTAGTDGAEPCGPLVVGTNNALYGTASVGGTYGFGTVFQVTTGGVFTVRHPFTGADGSGPVAALAAGADGQLYGTTQYGGTNDLGTVFKISTLGAFTSLLSFNGTNGAYPASALVQGSDLAFYGAVPFGGTNNFGGFFKITSSGTLTRLYQPPQETVGSNPVGLTLAPNGIFYGAAQYGGTNGYGSLFQLTNGVYTTLYTFNGLSDGANPATPLLSNGGYNLYGATAVGGQGDGGTIFDLTLLHLMTARRIGNQFIYSGAGGDPDAGYTVLTTTNLAGHSAWSLAGSGTFDANGAFVFTNNITLQDSMRFYRIREP